MICWSSWVVEIYIDVDVTVVYKNWIFLWLIPWTLMCRNRIIHTCIHKGEFLWNRWFRPLLLRLVLALINYHSAWTIVSQSLHVSVKYTMWAHSFIRLLSLRKQVILHLNDVLLILIKLLLIDYFVWLLWAYILGEVLLILFVSIIGRCVGCRV